MPSGMCDASLSLETKHRKQGETETEKQKERERLCRMESNKRAKRKKQV